MGKRMGSSSIGMNEIVADWMNGIVVDWNGRDRFGGETYVGEGSGVADGRERTHETTEDRNPEKQESCKNLQDRIPGFQDSRIPT